MIIKQITTHVGQDGILNISLPTVLSARDVDVILVIDDSQKGHKKRASLKNYLGLLKDSKSFGGDPLKLQERLRSDWN